MQIQKINNNKVKVILNSSDLIKKNIDVESFLSNSEETQNFFFEILEMIETEYSFDISDKKTIIEAISLENNIFVLTITRLENTVTQDILDPFSSVYVFNSSKSLFDFYYFITRKNISLNNIYIYMFSNMFYIFLKKTDHTFKDDINIFLTEFSSYVISDSLKSIILEHGKRVTFL